MKTLSLSLAALLVGASLSSAFADQSSPEGRLVPVAEAMHMTASPIVEGRQAAPIAHANLTDAERLVIERNLDTNN
jgi:hypothetical protein